MNACRFTTDDSLIRNAILESIASRGYSELLAVDVTVKDGTVVLRGTVATFYLKQIAQAAIGSVPGVRSLRSEIEVLPSPKSLPSSPSGFEV